MDHPPHVEADVVVDAVVVGAGIIGASSAYHLSAAGRTVAVLEARSGYAEGSSGRSFASVRSQWADHVSIELSWRSIQAYQRFEEEHGVDVGYRPTGYLLLWGEDVWARQLEAVALQRAHGVPVEVLDPADAQGLTPFATDGVAGTTYGPADGRIDPHIATGAYLGLARAAGAAVHFGSAVTGIERDTDDTWVVRTGMRTVRARYVVNAAGGWSSETAALAGISAPVVHSKRNVYASASGATDRVLPMTCDMATGVYLRSDGDRVLFGLSNPRQTDGYDTEVDWGWLEVLLGIAENRFPWLADLPLDSRACWAGTYENTPDAKPLLGPEPSAPGWIHACGFSGHGVMQAPEVGRLVAEQVSQGAITSLDVSSMSPQRFAGGTRALDMVI
jgi:sarcosine oxidase subunit beta